MFPSDLLPLTDEDIAYHLRLMHNSRADLLAILNGVTYDMLVRQPPGGGWCVRDVLRHVGGIERWYLDCINRKVDMPRTHSVFEFIALTRAWATDALISLAPDERCALILKYGEPWTARKVLRRFLEHEREHTAQIRDILARFDTLTP